MSAVSLRRLFNQAFSLFSAEGGRPTKAALSGGISLLLSFKYAQYETLLPSVAGGIKRSETLLDDGVERRVVRRKCHAPLDLDFLRRLLSRRSVGTDNYVVERMRTAGGIGFWR